MTRFSERMAALIVVALVATTAQAQSNRYETSFERELALRSGGIVSVEHSFGSVSIRTGSGSGVSVKAAIRASDPSFGEQIRIVAENRGDGVTIKTDYPERKTKRDGHSSYSVELQVTVPPGAPVRVTNRFGSVQASGIAGGSTIVNGHGSISLRDARGNQSVQNSFGSIAVDDLAGDLTASNSHGSIKVDGVRGTASITNRFGSIQASDVFRDATVTNSNGSVQVRDMRAAATVVNSFGSIQVDGIAGALRVEGNHSRVTVRDVRGDAQVSTTFGAIDVQEIGGTLRVTNNNGSVTAKEVRRDLSVRTSFGSARIEDIGGAVDVENQHGSISASGLARTACRPISLRTSFSPIKVSVGANASYAVNARTSYGRITSAIPIATASLSGASETVVGTIGGGECKLVLVTKNGSITIDRE